MARFILIGGFLGAGKTTTIGRLARRYLARGLRVAIVTNDQASDLVDTLSLRAQGFEVGEVAGACFCCSFRDLTSTVDRLSTDARPDVILAEPVGSCTDLVSTVLRPLEAVYERPLALAPFAVVFKPSHGLKILGDDPRGGFSPQAGYLFRKQLEEADLLLLNRIDELDEATASRLEELLGREYPGRHVMRISARQGVGFDELAAWLERDRAEHPRRPSMDLDYDRYAEGEAELGWLNGQARLVAEEPLALDDFLRDLVARLQTELAAQGGEVAHVKAIGLFEGHYAVANAVSSFTAPEVSLASGARVPAADVVVNARVAVDPDVLNEAVRRIIATVASEHGAACAIDSMQSFRPGRPVPTHRLVDAAG